MRYRYQRKNLCRTNDILFSLKRSRSFIANILMNFSLSKSNGVTKDALGTYNFNEENKVLSI